MMERAELFAKMFHGVNELETLYKGAIVIGNLDSSDTQISVKESYRNFSEEMAELYEAIFFNDKLDPNYYNARLDELVDSGNFLISMFLHSNIQSVGISNIPEYIPTASFKESVDQYFIMTQVKAGLACNLLKNRPWKKTYVRTDKALFEKTLLEALKAFASLGCILCNKVDDYEEAFNRKFNINLERLKSNY